MVGRQGGEQQGTAERAALEALHDAADDLLALESDPDLADDAIEPLRARALALYKGYVARFGPLNRGELREGRVDPRTGRPTLRWHRPPLGGFRRDPGYHTVMALEVYEQATGDAAPAPILLRRVHGRRVVPGEVTTPFEALAACPGVDGAVDLAGVAGVLGLPGETEALQALGDLVFRDPGRGGVWVTALHYLAGDVRAALATAVAAAGHDAAYERNVTTLRALVPPELGPLEIEVSLGSPVVEPGDIEAFVHEVLGGRVRVWHLPSAAWWKIVPTGRVPATAYGTARLGAYEILAAGLNGRLPMVVDSLPGPVPGRRVRRRNAAESLAAQDRLSALQERFRTWVWEDAARAERVCREYNRRFNSHVAPPDLGAALSFPGLADGVELWPWQREVVARVVSAPATLCAHAVGAGKTRSMIAAAMTARRLGLASKPLVAVPAHLVEQVAREARQAYPFGRFLVAGERDGGGDPVPAAVAARCATGDWDAVIVSHGLLAAVPVAPGAERADLAERIERTRSEIDAGAGGRHGRSVLRRRLTGLQARDGCGDEAVGACCAREGVT
ncbi:MAG: methyltransferase type 11, partial [Jatrophihabitans endophyticus]